MAITAPSQKLRNANMQVKIVQVPRSQTHTQMHTSAGNPLSPSQLSARIRQVSTHSSVKASARHVGNTGGQRVVQGWRTVCETASPGLSSRSG